MKRLAIIAATTLALAAPATADVAFAIQHFNQDRDSIAERIVQPTGENRTTVSTRNASPLSDAFAQFNASADNAAQLRGVEQATLATGSHSDRAAMIFAALRAESLSDE